MIRALQKGFIFRGCESRVITSRVCAAFLFLICVRFGLLASRGVTEVHDRRANGSCERREVKLLQKGCSQKQGETEPEPKEEQMSDTSCRDIGRPINRRVWQWGATALVIRQRRLGKQVNVQMESGWPVSDGRVSLSVFLPSKRKPRRCSIAWEHDLAFGRSLLFILDFSGWASRNWWY